MAVIGRYWDIINNFHTRNDVWVVGEAAAWREVVVSRICGVGMD